MRYANDKQGRRVGASPDLRGEAVVCGGCGSDVIAKCGDIVVHHWAHARNADCDPWHEPMTAWHIEWQDLLAPPERQEVRIGPHRADVVAHDGRVVEIQHSHLPRGEITKREEFYGDMIWIFDGRGWDFGYKALESELDLARYRFGRWRPTLEAVHRPLFIDCGRNVLQVAPVICSKTPYKFVRKGLAAIWSREDLSSFIRGTGQPENLVWDYAPGPVFVEIRGQTYPVKDAIKALGGVWSPREKAWVFTANSAWELEPMRRLAETAYGVSLNKITQSQYQSHTRPVRKRRIYEGPSESPIEEHPESFLEEYEVVGFNFRTQRNVWQRREPPAPPEPHEEPHGILHDRWKFSEILGKQIAKFGREGESNRDKFCENLGRQVAQLDREWQSLSVAEDDGWAKGIPKP